MKRKIVFLTGTRADYGKIKSLMRKIDEDEMFNLHIFVTGMHLLAKYGSTYREIEKDGFKNIYKYINQKYNAHMDIALSNTILGFSNYISEIDPDLIVVHGDRLEALAGAIVGAFNNIKVAHIEGGEVSGTIDESIRHAITKFSHIHFVANEEAKARVMQLGEREDSIYIIGSPDIDIMYSEDLPTIDQVKKRYDILFNDYAIVMYHPVTTEIDKLKENVKKFVDALLKSEKRYIVIYPNNDDGTSIILDEYKRLEKHPNFKLYPSIRFEHFLTLLRYCEFMIGNSSAGIREAGIYSIPSIDIGSRQQGRYDVNKNTNIIHVSDNYFEILNAIINIHTSTVISTSIFGNGRSDEKFIEILKDTKIWEKNFQKKFMDISCIIKNTTDIIA